MYSWVNMILQSEVTSFAADLKDNVLSAIFFILLAVFLLWVFRWFRKYLLANLMPNINLTLTENRRLRLFVALALIGLGLLIVLLIFGWDLTFFEQGQFKFNLTLVLSGALLILSANIIDYIITGFYRRYKEEQGNALGVPSEPDQKPKEVVQGRRMIQTLVVLYIFYYFLKSVALDYTIYQTEIDNRNLVITISSILKVFIVFMAARLIIWLMIHVVMTSYYRSKDINIGTRFAINQILTYILYLIAAFIAVESLGLKMTVIWGALGALLIGLGLGIQHTLNDFFSGFLLLLERSVEVGDVLHLRNYDRQLARVSKIGLRSSKLRTLDNIFIIMPNSELINQSVVNLSHFDNKARFEISVGVRYGSDTDLVQKVLLRCASAHPLVLKYPKPHVLMRGFSNSSLDFDLYFHTKEYMKAPKIKSDIRLLIDKAFREQGIEIPFPQMDVWLRENLPPNPPLP